jgi:uncharacterized protein YaaN involved in tellurite resistance
MKPLFENDKQNVETAVQPSMAEHGAKPVAQVEVVTEQQIDQLGEKNALVLSDISHKMLTHVRAADADAFGQKLNELVGVAKNLNPSRFENPGILSRLTGFFGSAKEKILAQFQTVDSRMQALIKELDHSTSLHTERIQDMEEMYAANVNAHGALEAAVAEGNRLVRVLQAQLAQESQATDAFSAQRVNDVKNRIDRLEKRIDDLQRAMLLAKQAAPEIRLLQENARTLSMKFKDVKAVTIPAWQNAFALYLMQLEQKKGAALVTAVHDATDEAFRMQADLLRQNTEAIARAKQRSIVSVETLEHVQKQLLASFDDMNRIAEEGRRSRTEALPKLKALEQELVNRFVTQAN